MNLNEIKHSKRKNIGYQITPKFICTYSVLLPNHLFQSLFMEVCSGQNYLINFLRCIFNFVSFVFNSTVERTNFMTCISNFLIRPINFMLFNHMACGINFMRDILYSYLAGCCPISDFIGYPLPNKSDIGQAVDQTTVLLFPPRISILLTIGFNYFKSYICVHRA